MGTSSQTNTHESLESKISVILFFQGRMSGVTFGSLPFSKNEERCEKKEITRSKQEENLKKVIEFRILKSFFPKFFLGSAPWYRLKSLVEVE